VSLEIAKMNPHSLKGLILDLRDNAGGLLSEAACLAGLFIGEDKKIFTASYMDNLMEESQTTTGQEYFGPMVILTNSRSASASELLAGAMQEYKRAILIGERTFGKGSFQKIESWNDSPHISLYQTEGFYLLPSGKSTQLTGVVPDLIVNDDKDGKREIDIYQYPLKYKSNEITKVKSGFSDNDWKTCLQNVSNYEIDEDKILKSAQNFLNCQIKSN
jgi:carboxyl-terminal processing protease